jgi:hypothetical protein
LVTPPLWQVRSTAGGGVHPIAYETKALEPEVKVLRWANEIPKLAGDYFAQAELECHLKG